MISFGDSVRSFRAGVHRVFAASAKKTTVVICPTAQLPAKVRLDADSRMEGCSRWPELQEGCSEACSPQIEFSPEELQDFMARAEGKKCSSCGMVIMADDWYRNRLAALERSTECGKVTRSRSHWVHKSTAPTCPSCYSAKIS